MKYLLSCLLVYALVSCQANQNAASVQDSLAFSDSGAGNFDRDSAMAAIKVETMNMVASDTQGLYLAPIKVISANPYEDEYSSFKKIKLLYKNVSDKNITAIKFSWYGIKRIW